MGNRLAMAWSSSSTPTATGKPGLSWWAPEAFEGAPDPTTADGPSMFSAIRKNIVVDPASWVAVAEPEVTPVPAGHVRCVLVSDTHSAHKAMRPLPAGDILIHAGDFSNVGEADDILDFADWVERQTQFRARVVIAGNHDLSLDPESYPRNYSRFGHAKKADTAALIARLREVCTYLDHEVVEVCGVRIFGSPYQPEFCDWAFNLNRAHECRQKWSQMVPLYEEKPFDILVTHGPPLGHGDTCVGSGPQGCWDLLDFVEAFPPKLHVFGHIHECFGCTANRRTLFANASTMNYRYDIRKLRKPIVIDVPIGQDSATIGAWHKTLVTPPMKPPAPKSESDAESDGMTSD